MKRLANMDFTEFGATKNDSDQIPYFRFDQDALQIFYSWLTTLEEKKLTADDNPILIEHLAKYRSLMPSLALIFHLIDTADGKPGKNVRLDHVLNAFCWCDYLEKHARRIYGMAHDVTRQAAIKTWQ